MLLVKTILISIETKVLSEDSRVPVNSEKTISFNKLKIIEEILLMLLGTRGLNSKNSKPNKRNRS